MQSFVQKAPATDMKSDTYNSPEEPNHLSHRSSSERHHGVSESYDLKIQRLDR